ncbi:(2Fe-2S)-binding protein [Azoarcus olearius]|uniref:Bacterioferritin-associated ferredoxin n=1 Tax=Azoarcus sp. (strain BH72) TaxID=418699 RepID=A1K329_AZOSB|nr:(2Fe-2S)-binding protein [Azoarcus olearius]ANQ83761.1 bacterioferritin-associated ferredoxin [Azoarcus olearius]CAL93234.1 conserved hypothetical bacterioferritin-associated ferredoxin [Azoarcus olearius]
MYVCVCNAVTERHINEAVREGVSTLRHLRKELGVTAECGRCAVCARDCLRSALAEKTQRPAAAPVHIGVAPSFSLAAEAS